MMRVGVLSIQGGVAEHVAVFQKMGVEPMLVRDRKLLAEVTHLVIPGGESTTLQLLLEKNGMWSLLKKRTSANDLRVFGTCAGAILCSRLGASWEVDRNGFGAQQQSFSVTLESDKFPSFRGVFIRAPKFKNLAPRVEILATFSTEPALVRDGNFLAANFHPELTDDTRIHEFFLKN